MRLGSKDKTPPRLRSCTAFQPTKRFAFWRPPIAHISTPEPIWTPQAGPQSNAFTDDCDIIGYGGAAGGGKSELLLGLAALKHRRSIIFRRVFPSARDIIERSRALLGSHFSFNESLHIWRLG